MMVCRFPPRRVFTSWYSAETVKLVVISVPRSSSIMRSQSRYSLTLAAAASASAASREKRCVSNSPSALGALSYATEQPFPATSRAMQAERKVLPSPGPPRKMRLGEPDEKLAAYARQVSNTMLITSRGEAPSAGSVSAL